MKRRCSVCQRIGHDRRQHVRRNLAAFTDAHGKHPIRASSDYDPVIAGEFQKLTPARTRARLDRTRAQFEAALKSYPKATDKRGLEKRIDALDRQAQQLDRYKREQEERRARDLDGLEAQIGALQDALRELPTDLIWLIRKSGNLRGEIGSVPANEWNRHMPSFKARRGMLNRAGRVEPIFALDALASERGYRDTEELMKDAKRARTVQSELDDLRKEASRAEADLRDLGLRVGKKNPLSRRPSASVGRRASRPKRGGGMKRHCSQCGSPHHDKRYHRARRNLDGSIYGGTFHPYRRSAGYSRVLAGDVSRRSGR